MRLRESGTNASERSKAMRSGTAPRKRATTVTLSLVTTSDVASEIRGRAAARDVPVSTVLEELVLGALRHGARSRVSARAAATLRAPRSAADAPEAVRKLFKSYDPSALHWDTPGHQHEIVVAILTRGNADAKRWLWKVMSHEEARELVRLHRGAGSAEPERAVLRRELGLSEADLPRRAYLGFGDRRATPVKVLDAEKRRVIATQAQVVQQEQFFLAGGTGLGVPLGHRVSRDVDWFTARAFDAQDIAHRLAALPQKPSELVIQGPHTLRAYYGSFETSFIR